MLLSRSAAAGLSLALALLLAPAAAGSDALDPGEGAEAKEAPVARRVVSMNPSLTAIFVALGATSSLVGVDEYSARQQEAVADLPRVGGLFSPDLEAAVALQPDLVVLVPSMEQRSFRERLEELGIPVLALPNLSFDSVLHSIAEIGRRVGREEAAQKRIEAIRRTRAEIEQATEDRSRPRALLVIQREPIFVVGPASFLDEMLRAAGAENAAAELGSPYPRVTAEWVVSSAPDVILDSSGDGEDALEYWSRWPSLPAVRSDRVVAVPQGIVTLPGPYLDRALARLARILHGPAVLAHVGAAR